MIAYSNNDDFSLEAQWPFVLRVGSTVSIPKSNIKEGLQYKPLVIIVDYPFFYS